MTWPGGRSRCKLSGGDGAKNMVSLVTSLRDDLERATHELGRKAFVVASESRVNAKPEP